MENRVRRPEGCTMLHVAELKNTESAITYGEQERLYGLEEISCTYNYAEGAAYSDNQQDTSIRRPSSAELEIKIRQLSPKTEARLMGKRYVKGKKVTSTNDTAPPWAVSYRQTNSDGSYTNKLFYNCTVSREEGTITTVKDGIEYDVVTLKVKALPLPNGDLDLEFDNDADGVTEKDLTDFFKTVMMPPTEDQEGVTVTKADLRKK